MKDKLSSEQGWDAIERDQTTYNLIMRIRRITIGFEEHKQGTYNLIQSKRRLLTVPTYSMSHIQEEKESVVDYVRSTVEAFGVTLGLHMGHLQAWINDTDWIVDPNNPTDAKNERARRESEEAIAASLKVGGANHAKFGELKRSLAKDYLKGDDNYPTIIEDARKLLQNYEPAWKPKIPT